MLIAVGAVAAPAPAFKQPETLKEILALSPAELENCDIARMNLICAERLPGAESLSVDNSLVALDSWAQHIKSEADRNFHRFQESPAYYYNSTNFYKMLMMAVVLYEDYNIRYNPKWISPPGSERPDDHFFADASDILIPGLVSSRRMGTCSSMPILYIALGRRLGYPLKLVKSKEHLFMRWDSPTEQFDMDATGKGLDKRDDEFYKKWPFPLTAQAIHDEDYLKSLSTCEELSVFLTIRGACFTEAGRLAEATTSFKDAYLRAPNWKGNQIMLVAAEQRSMPHYLPLDSHVSREQQALDAVPQPQGMDTGTPKIPDPDPLKQLQIQNPTMNPIPNP